VPDDIDNNIDVITDYTTFKPQNKEQLKEHIIDKLKIGITDFNYIDVSRITDFSNLFECMDLGNIDISEWDVNNGKNFSGMFKDCETFNCDLS
jgi:hypothetical protein